MPKAKKRVTKKAYKAKRGRRYRGRTHSEGTSFIGPGIATVVKPNLPMVPFRNTGLITPPPLMQLPTNWRRMSEMGIQPAQFPNIPMQLVQVQEPKTEAQKLAEERQQVVRTGNAMRAAAQEIQEQQKKKDELIKKYAEGVDIDPNLPGGSEALIESAVLNREVAVLNAINPVLAQVPIPIVPANKPNPEIEVLTNQVDRVDLEPPDVGRMIHDALSDDDNKYDDESPVVYSASSASRLTPVPVTPLVSPPSNQLASSPEVNQLRLNYMEALKLKKQALIDYHKKKITKEEFNAVVKSANDALSKLTQLNSMRKTPARIALPNTPAPTPAPFKTPGLQRQMEELRQRYSPEATKLSTYMSPNTMINEFKQINQRLAKTRASQPSASSLSLTPAEKVASRMFIKPLTPDQQKIANAIEAHAIKRTIERGLPAIQEGRQGLRQNRKPRMPFTPS